MFYQIYKIVKFWLLKHKAFVNLNDKKIDCKCLQKNIENL